MSNQIRRGGDHPFPTHEKGAPIGRRPAGGYRIPDYLKNSRSKERRDHGCEADGPPARMSRARARISSLRSILRRLACHSRSAASSMQSDAKMATPWASRFASLRARLAKRTSNRALRTGEPFERSISAADNRSSRSVTKVIPPCCWSWSISAAPPCADRDTLDAPTGLAVGLGPRVTPPGFPGYTPFLGPPFRASPGLGYP